MAPKKKIPDGWLDYSPINEVIHDARIVPFKTPLPASKFHQENLERFKWTTYDLMDYLSYKGTPLGLVIDFTYKFPAYYDVNDFIQNGVHFEKVGCVGHDVPTEERFLKFCDVVEAFLYDNRYNNRVIGVHCTHGINRTGYMVCKYLIHKLGYHPDRAIATFASSRGYPIERDNYIHALRTLHQPH